MDRNSLIGFLLIGLLLVGYYKLNSPEKDLNQQDLTTTRVEEENVKETAYTLQKEDEAKVDSLLRDNKYGVFSEAAVLKDTLEKETIETDLLKIKFSKKGGQI